MIIIEGNNRSYSDQDLINALKPFSLKGKTVLIYSRLFSLGKITGIAAIARIIEIFQESVGIDGTICFPCYTFSAYNKEVFDLHNSKCVVGVLGELARKNDNFIRTNHPVYSNVCWGKNAKELNNQDFTTCFGQNSFFDKFHNLPNSYVLMFGTNLSAATIYHYYDQKYNTPGRFVKTFDAKIKIDNEIKTIKFDSYVKNYDFYQDKTNCLARFDALLSQYLLLTRKPFASDWIVGISEKTFHDVYKLCINTDPLYYLFSSEDNWQAYYQDNKYDLFKEQLNTNKIAKIEALLPKL